MQVKCLVILLWHSHSRDQRCAPDAMSPAAAPDATTYLSASGISAILNFPLWKAATIGQAGFAEAAQGFWAKIRILLGPPYKGVAATMFGMTWARAAIFYCSDYGKEVPRRPPLRRALVCI